MPDSHTPTSSSPHPTRASTPRPPAQVASDHTVSFRHKLSLREYPPDCPPLNVRWFYAVDVPKRKQFPPKDATEKPSKLPSKFVPFGARDSRAIESAFQKLSEEEDAVESRSYVLAGEGRERRKVSGGAKVPVNEDYLFDVDIKNRELAPVYWLGPVYDVRRGTWFIQDGSGLKPCDENLATQVEEGYLRLKPFRQPPPPPAEPPSSIATTTTAKSEDTPPSSSAGSIFAPSAPPPPQPQQQSWRLFGAYLNSFVVFVDPSTAWLLTDDFYGKLSATVFQRISAGSHMGGTKIVRGYTEVTKSPQKPASSEKEKEREKEKEKADGAPARPVTPNPEPSEKIPVPKLNRLSMPPPSTSTALDDMETSRRALERKMSSLSATSTTEDQEVQEAMLENEMKEDYQADEALDDPGREIEHVILVTHGIGQKLSMRMESVNFVHDVNVLRKSLKGVYGLSPDLQVLNGEAGDKVGGRRNCKIQCLPVCWRHLLDFPHHSRRATKSNELDLSSGFSSSKDEYPSLADITVEGVPAVRSLMTDLALDVLLYQSATYREHIAEIVRQECNRIYRLFRARNPEFKGKVSLIGHSLGSAILFDILCRQPDRIIPDEGLEFDVENFFCLGSPIGLFEMLKGNTISARSPPPISSKFPPSPLPQSVSAPKCAQLFNIFHPTDPISYRLEPLVSTAMSELKPQPLPYTKRSLFGATPLVGITGLGQSVTRSVSGLWTSLSSGVASAILNRSLGFDAGGPPSSATSSVSSTTEKGTSPPSTVGTEERIETEIETLYAGFQKRHGEESGEEVEEKAWRLRLEEEKVRRLNETGRIDFAIQEGVFDISLIASIASHLSYWSDEDVNHFVISQLLARNVRKKKDFTFGRE
ncbi:hypothetical protein RUND412_008715 [Rhizina undulata]